VTPTLQFGENQNPVDGHLIGTTIGGDQSDGLDAGFKRIQQFRRQTDGTGSVMSDCAVFNGNNHQSAPEIEWNYYIVNYRGKVLEACFWYNHIRALHNETVF